MSYEAERIAVTNFIQSQSFFGLSPFGLDGGEMEVAANTGFMTLQAGRGARISTGAPGANLHRYVSLLQITVITEGGGSSAARAFGDTIVNAFTGLSLDESGSTPTPASAMVLDFDMPDGGTPYIAESRPEGPFHRVVVNVPFIRTERK